MISVLGALQFLRFDNASTIIDKANIHTTGVARCAVEGDDGSDTLIKNSKIKVDGGMLYDGYINSANTETMVAPPWVLGIVGNARATNLLGDNSTMTVYNSNVYAAKRRGACRPPSAATLCSTPSTAKSTWISAEHDLTEDSGYGAYAIGSATENFYGSTFNVPTYAVICANGDNVVNFLSSKGNIQTMKYSDAKKGIRQRTVFFQGFTGKRSEDYSQLRKLWRQRVGRRNR